MTKQEMDAKGNNLKEELRKKTLKILLLHGTGNMATDFSMLFMNAMDITLCTLTAFSNKEEAFKTTLKMLDSVKDVYTKAAKEEGYDLENQVSRE